MGQNELDPIAGSGVRGCGLFLAWFGTEVIGWIIMALVGPEGLLWLVGVSMLIGIVFVMVYGSIRVLRGHDL